LFLGLRIGKDLGSISKPEKMVLIYYTLRFIVL
jgi:hypothetical protein